MQRVKPPIRILLPGIVILFLGLSFHAGSLNEFPLGHHSWTQIDHYVLSLRFQENGFDFFHPETYFISRYPVDGKEFATGETITAVDFPIHQYIIGLLYAMTADAPIAVARGYMLLLSFIGLIFLWRLAILITGKSEKALIPLVIVATSPLFVFFQSAIMPTIPAWAATIAGLYYFLKSIKTNNPKHFYWAVFFLSLAAMVRTTFVMPLLAVCATQWLFWLRARTLHIPSIAATVLGFMAIGGYYVYNSVLRKEYGSIFLSALLPAKNWDELRSIFIHVMETWGLHFFSIWQYLLMMAVAIVGLIFALRQKQLSQIQQQLVVLTIIWLVGCFMFFIALALQFPNHDYYFLDTFFTPIILLVVFFLSVISLPTKRWLSFAVATLILILAIPMWKDAHAFKIALSDTDWWNRIAITHHNFQDSNLLLEELNIVEDAVILVIDAYSPNLPLLHLKRTGHPLLNTGRNHLQQAMTWDWDYAVIQNEFFFSDVYQNYPEIINELEWVGGNGKLSVYRESATVAGQGLHNFLGLHHQKSVFESHFQIGESNDEWSVWIENTEESANLTNTEFPITFRKTHLDFEDKHVQMLINVWAATADSALSELVVKIDRNDSILFYRSYDFNHSSSLMAATYLQLPALLAGDVLSAYLWNRNKRNSYWIEEGKVELYVD